MSLLRSSVTIASFTLLSRIFGFVRDVFIANLMGAGALTDAFFVAFKLPNFFRRLFAEGAFTAAFLPMYAGLLRVDGSEKAHRFASSIMTILLVILLVLTTLIVIFMPEVLSLVAPGFRDDPELFELTVYLTRLTFPYLIFISIVSLLGGVLNSHDRFAAVAFTPVLLNICLITCLWVLPGWIAEGYAQALSMGVCVAGFVQVAWLIFVNIRNHSMPKLVWPEYNENIRKMLRNFIPVALGAGVAQVNQLVDVILATSLDTAVSYLYYADRLYELPLGIIGIAVATALLPILSKQVRAGEVAAARVAIDQALRFVLLIGIPSAVALSTIALPIIMTIYEHGEFTRQHSLMVAPALWAYCVGLPGFLITRIFANCFFATTDTKTPVKIAVVCVLTNIVFNLILIQYYGHVGLAMATTISGWLNALLLAIGLYRRNLCRPDASFWLYVLKLGVAAACMAIVLLLVQDMIQHWYLRDGLLMKAVGTTLLIAVGGSTYFAIALGLRAVRVADIKRLLPKQKS